MPKTIATIIGIGLLLVIGCAAPRPTPAEPEAATAEAVAQAIAEGIVVTFDGNECTVSGPTELPTGEHSFVLKDLSGQDQTLYVSRLLDGKTFQDLLDLQSEPGESFPKPSWVIWKGRRTERIAEGERVYTFFLDKEGKHAIYLGAVRPLSLWFCAPLKVIEAPSE